MSKVQIMILTTAICVILGKLLDFSVPLFTHLSTRIVAWIKEDNMSEVFSMVTDRE